MPINPVPPDNRIADKSGMLTDVWQAFMASVQTWLGPVGLSGSTTNRPKDSSRAQLYIGQQYFDTTLHKPIWVKSKGPTVWVDATGTPV